MLAIYIDGQRRYADATAVFDICFFSLKIFVNTNEHIILQVSGFAFAGYVAGVVTYLAASQVHLPLLPGA